MTDSEDENKIKNSYSNHLIIKNIGNNDNSLKNQFLSANSNIFINEDDEVSKHQSFINNRYHINKQYRSEKSIIKEKDFDHTKESSDFNQIEKQIVQLNELEKKFISHLLIIHILLEFFLMLVSLFILLLLPDIIHTNEITDKEPSWIIINIFYFLIKNNRGIYFYNYLTCLANNSCNDFTVENLKFFSLEYYNINMAMISGFIVYF